MDSGDVEQRTTSVQQMAPPSRAAEGKGRIDAIDFTKGALVVLMVLYHTLNYLDYGTIPHDYMAFLPPSFIMLAGFLVAASSVSRQGQPGSDRRTKLLVRAFKLLVLFTCLNIAAPLVRAARGDGAQVGLQNYLLGWREAYLGVNGGNIAFEVLVPIAYTLIVAAFAVPLNAKRPQFLAILALITFALCMVSDIFGHANGYFNLMSAGVIGMWLGTFDLRVIDRFATSWLLIGAAIAAYVALTAFGPDDYVSQTLKTLVCVFALYGIGHMQREPSAWFRQLCLLGTYSLVGYIVQIAYLQPVRALQTQGLPASHEKVALVIVAVCLATWATVVTVAYLRSRSVMINRLYTLVIG